MSDDVLDVLQSFKEQNGGGASTPSIYRQTNKRSDAASDSQPDFTVTSSRIFDVDQALEMLRVSLVTVLAREMRLNFFLNRPSFGQSASAASHDIGARNAIENDQAMEMFRVSLVTVLAQEVRLKFLEVDQALEMLRVSLVTVLAREMRLKIFEIDQALEKVRVPLVTIWAREKRVKTTKLCKFCECRYTRYWREKCSWGYSQNCRNLW